MVGLSVLLESQQLNMNYNHHNSPQVVNKASLIKSSPPPSPSFSSSSSSSSFSATRYGSSLPTSSFLDECFLCKQRLLPGKDIFMYNGDRAFCSKECRCRQILMDEENVGMGTRKSKPSSSSSSSARQSKKNKSKAGGYAFQD